MVYFKVQFVLHLYEFVLMMLLMCCDEKFLKINLNQTQICLAVSLSNSYTILK